MSQRTILEEHGFISLSQLRKFRYGTNKPMAHMAETILDLRTENLTIARALKELCDRISKPTPGDHIEVADYLKHVEGVEARDRKDKAATWERLIEFICDPTDMSPEELRKDLEDQGVDVDAFLKRIHDTVKRFSEEDQPKEGEKV